MRTILVLRGLPGCGKSTWAKKLMKKESKRWKRFNRDDLRGMIDDGEYSPEREEFIREVQDTLIRTALAEGYDVIVDNTHLVPQTLKKLHKLAESVGDVEVLEKCFNETVETCLQRNSEREGRARVPDKVIKDMARGAGIDRGRKLEDKKAYYPPCLTGEIVAQDESLPAAILCDLDGTLALIGDRSPYDAKDCDIIDKPNWPVIRTVMAHHAQGVKVIFMSGRDVKYRPETERFIKEYCKTQERVFDVEDEEYMIVNRPIPYELHMRGELDETKTDQRKDSIIKSELFDAHVRGKYNVLFVLDDRNQVVDLWRSLGLTCFQVNYGNF